MNRKERRASKRNGETLVSDLDDRLVIIWLAHFADIVPFSGASCKDCASFRVKACKGGKVPEACILEKAEDERVEVARSTNNHSNR